LLRAFVALLLALRTLLLTLLLGRGGALVTPLLCGVGLSLHLPVLLRPLLGVLLAQRAPGGGRVTPLRLRDAVRTSDMGAGRALRP
jgi:hypothetical protein